MIVRTIVATLVAGALLAGTGAYAQCSGCGGNKPQTTGQTKTDKGVQKATVVIDGGYTPSSITAKVGTPLELTFVRKEKQGCGGDVVFKSLNIRKSVASGGKIVIKFTPKKGGEIVFTCGMGMYRGKVVVK